MQEHIRRAHPEHYIAKLPATEESFLLMVNTPPTERPHTDQSPASVTQGMLHLTNTTQLRLGPVANCFRLPRAPE